MKPTVFFYNSGDVASFRQFLSDLIKAENIRMKHPLLVLFMIVLMQSLNAQTMQNGLMDNFRLKKITDGTYVRHNLKMSDIQGTPYLDEEFNSGKIISGEGKIYENVPLRYNAFTDDLEFKKGDDSYNIDPKTIVKRAEFGGVVFSCMSYESNSKTQTGFFEILTEGKATLLVKYTVRFLEKEAVKAFAEPKPARFDAAQKEYFITFDGSPAKLISNKKSLLEMFGAQKSEMESFISKNKLSVKSDDALTKIVVHFNSL